MSVFNFVFVVVVVLVGVDDSFLLRLGGNRVDGVGGDLLLLRRGGEVDSETGVNGSDEFLEEFLEKGGKPRSQNARR